MEDARIGAALLLLFGYCWFYVVNMMDGKETCKSETIERTKNILTTPNLSGCRLCEFQELQNYSDKLDYF